MSSTTFHRNGDVTFWDVYSQTWRRLPAIEIADSNLMIPLPESVCQRIARTVAVAYAAELGATRVRVRGDEVHGHGYMPNSIVIGWYLVGHTDDLVRQAVIQRKMTDLEDQAER